MSENSKESFVVTVGESDRKVKVFLENESDKEVFQLVIDDDNIDDDIDDAFLLYFIDKAFLRSISHSYTFDETYASLKREWNKESFSDQSIYRHRYQTMIRNRTPFDHDDDVIYSDEITFKEKCRRYYVKRSIIIQRRCEFINCTETFRNPDDLHRHVIQRHINNDDDNKTGNSIMRCIDCVDVTFDTSSKLKYHRLKHHGKWKLRESICDLCDKRFQTESNLRRHLRNIHNTGQSSSSSLKRSCPDCSFTCKDSFHLKIHRRKHSGERPHICDLCTFGFYKKSDLKTHRSKCKGIKYKCDHCQSVFHFKREFRDHALWSESCGTVGGNDDKRRSIIRFNITKDTSVVGVNCENLIDTSFFYKRKKRSRCGICGHCQRTSNCGECKTCIIDSKTCQRMQCINLIEQYDVKTEKRNEVVVQSLLNRVQDEDDKRRYSTLQEITFDKEIVLHEKVLEG